MADNYLEKNKLGDFDETKYNSLVDYIEANYAPISEVVEREHVLNLVTKGDLENYVKKTDLPSLDNLATETQLDNLATNVDGKLAHSTRIKLDLLLQEIGFDFSKHVIKKTDEHVVGQDEASK